MTYQLLVEDIEPGHWVASVRELPGCFSSARTQAAAVAGAPSAIDRYFEWRAVLPEPEPARRESPVIDIAEFFKSFPSQKDPDYLVNAFFDSDRAPLTQAEVDEGLRLLDCTRRDLFVAIADLAPEQLAQPIPGEVNQTLGGVLLHIGGAEWWYFRNLGLTPKKASLSNDPLTRLEQVRANTLAQLPALVGDARILTQGEESWSARKVLRRTIWHERDHTEQILAYRTNC